MSYPCEIPSVDFEIFVRGLVNFGSLKLFGIGKRVLQGDSGGLRLGWVD